MKSNELVKYVRNRRFEPIGVVVATKTDRGDVYLTWSKCMKSDQFSRKEGLRIARERVFDGVSARVPLSFSPTIEDVTRRAKATFGVDRINYRMVW